MTAVCAPVDNTLDDLAADGYDESTATKYAEGDRCWGGQARSSVVMLECAEVDAILRVDEPETCSYTLRVTTPAVCTEADIPSRIGGEPKGTGEVQEMGSGQGESHGEL